MIVQVKLEGKKRKDKPIIDIEAENVHWCNDCKHTDKCPKFPRETGSTPIIDLVSDNPEVKGIEVTSLNYGLFMGVSWVSKCDKFALKRPVSPETETVSPDEENCLDCPHWIEANKEEIKATVGLLVADAGEELLKVNKKILAAAVAEYQAMDI